MCAVWIGAKATGRKEPLTRLSEGRPFGTVACVEVTFHRTTRLVFVLIAISVLTDCALR